MIDIQAGSSDPEVTDQAPDDEDVGVSGEKPRAQWRYKTRFPIQDRMAEVVKLSIRTSELQLRKYHRKLRKIQYGSSGG